MIWIFFTFCLSPPYDVIHWTLVAELSVRTVEKNCIIKIRFQCKAFGNDNQAVIILMSFCNVIYRLFWFFICHETTSMTKRTQFIVAKNWTDRCLLSQSWLKNCHQWRTKITFQWNTAITFHNYFKIPIILFFPFNKQLPQEQNKLFNIPLWQMVCNPNL